MTSLSFIHRFLPASDPATARTVLLLHGTGGDEDDLLPLGKEIDPTANILSPRGKVLENGMPRFFRRFAEGVFDVEDIKVRAQELSDFVSEAAKHYGFDARKVTTVGYSNGANIAAAILLLHPDVVAEAILLRAMLPLQPKEQPKLSTKRVLILAGTMDSMIPRAGTEQLIETLQRGGAQVKVVWQQAGHGLIKEDVEEATRFARE